MPGYVGGTLSTRSCAGLHTDTGTRVGLTAPLNGLLTATEGKTFVLPLTTAYQAAAGNHWVALLVSGPTTKQNGPAVMVGSAKGEAPGSSARMPGAFIRHGRLSATGQTSLPTSFPVSSVSSVVADSNAIWAAVS
ncbi:hypothetical protein [Streptomyces poonensis]|uniref:hypothetical protein n=1 Tax=Streptomyces poonensis TaxID=68255 RepID=UPI00167B289C|nr:hypothetical protein [Streptomyces poonensis]